MAIMEAKINRLSKRPASPAPASDDDDDDLDLNDVTIKKVETPEEELSDLEVYQNELSQLAVDRESTLNDLLAMMELTPKYSDVSEVCTRQRFEDIFEAAAEDLVSKEGGDLITAQLAVELNVWKKPNPYAYMYTIIKKHHPDFAEPKDDARPDDKAGDDGDKDKDGKVADKDSPADKNKDKKKTPPDTPVSALDLARGGGQKNLGEWTAERIDAMPEHELDKVPQDIYEMYLAGELDK